MCTSATRVLETSSVFNKSFKPPSPNNVRNLSACWSVYSTRCDRSWLKPSSLLRSVVLWKKIFQWRLFSALRYLKQRHYLCWKSQVRYWWNLINDLLKWTRAESSACKDNLWQRNLEAKRVRICLNERTLRSSVSCEVCSPIPIWRKINCCKISHFQSFIMNTTIRLSLIDIL